MRTKQTIQQAVDILEKTLSEIEELHDSGDAEALIKAKINILYYVLGEE